MTPRGEDWSEPSNDQSILPDDCYPCGDRTLRPLAVCVVGLDRALEVPASADDWCPRIPGEKPEAGRVLVQDLETGEFRVVKKHAQPNGDYRYTTITEEGRRMAATDQEANLTWNLILHAKPGE